MNDGLFLTRDELQAAWEALGIMEGEGLATQHSEKLDRRITMFMIADND